MTPADAASDKILLNKAYASNVKLLGEEGEEDSDTDADSRISTWVVSTSAKDRDGDMLMVDGWYLDNFRRGGSILFGHNREKNSDGLPIAKPLKTWVGNDALNIRMRHTTKDENPFGASVFELVKGGFLRSNSVGFLPVSWEALYENDFFVGYRFTEQELLEDSIVPVPSNPEALLQSLGKSMDLTPIVDWHQRALDNEVPRLGVDEHFILDSLKALSGNPVALAVPGTTDKSEGEDPAPDVTGDAGEGDGGESPDADPTPAAPTSDKVEGSEPSEEPTGEDGEESTDTDEGVEGTTQRDPEGDEPSADEPEAPKSTNEIFAKALSDFTEALEVATEAGVNTRDALEALKNLVARSTKAVGEDYYTLADDEEGDNDEELFDIDPETIKSAVQDALNAGITPLTGQVF